jgi:hypothetical protein
MYDAKRSYSEGDKIGAGLGVAALLPLGDFGKLGKQFERIQDAWKSARHIREIDPKDVVDALRATGRIKSSVNIAATTVDVRGLDPMVLVATSGRQTRPGMVPSPGDAVGGYPQRYIPVQRDSDSEQKIFNYLADKLGPPNEYASGAIRLHSQRVMCDSCGGVLNSFRNDYPNIQVIVTEG